MWWSCFVGSEREAGIPEGVTVKSLEEGSSELSGLRALSFAAYSEDRLVASCSLELKSELGVDVNVPLALVSRMPGARITLQRLEGESEDLQKVAAWAALGQLRGVDVYELLAPEWAFPVLEECGVVPMTNERAQRDLEVAKTFLNQGRLTEAEAVFGEKIPENWKFHLLQRAPTLLFQHTLEDVPAVETSPTLEVLGDDDIARHARHRFEVFGDDPNSVGKFLNTKRAIPSLEIRDGTEHAGACLLSGEGLVVINAIYILEPWRREGLATQLLAQALRDSRDLGAKAVLAHVSEENKASLALFEKLGFKQIKTLGELQDLGILTGQLYGNDLMRVCRNQGITLL